MALTIKETDWITIDYDKPETLPKVGDCILLHGCGFHTGLVEKDSENGSLCCMGEDEEDLVNGVRYVKIERCTDLTWNRVGDFDLEKLINTWAFYDIGEEWPELIKIVEIVDYDENDNNYCFLAALDWLDEYLDEEDPELLDDFSIIPVIIEGHSANC